MSVFRYAKTTDPDVIALAERNAAGSIDFHRRACDFAIAQGVELGTYYRSSGFGMLGIRAVGGDTAPKTGRWKRGYGGYGWIPWANNPLSAEMSAITFRIETPAGYPPLVRAGELGGGAVVAAPAPFVHDGMAYIGFSFAPDDDSEADMTLGVWTEIRASEFMAAREAFEDAPKAATRNPGSGELTNLDERWNTSLDGVKAFLAQESHLPLSRGTLDGEVNLGAWLA